MKSFTVKSRFGELPGGEAVHLYTLTNSNGLVAKILDYGTTITELHVPDRKGHMADVVLGFDNLDQYLKQSPYFGCTVGRFANRIARGRFTLDGKSYNLAVNNGLNHLHGGVKGFDKVIWKAKPLSGACVAFSYVSPNGDQGYPGELSVIVTITLTDADELRIDYAAKSKARTPVNLTNHAYFNLAGHGDILRHQLMLNAGFYTPPDKTLIPTGEILGVKGTVMDFTKPKAIGARFKQMKWKPRGYDHNFVLNGGEGLALAARVSEPKSGRVMEILTTEPGVQLYTSNYLDGSIKGKGGQVYGQYAGFCLETQHFPDSVNRPYFPNTILEPGQLWSSTTVHTFSAE